MMHGTNMVGANYYADAL